MKLIVPYTHFAHMYYSLHNPNSPKPKKRTVNAFINNVNVKYLGFVKIWPEGPK